MVARYLTRMEAADSEKSTIVGTYNRKKAL